MLANFTCLINTLSSLAHCEQSKSSLGWSKFFPNRAFYGQFWAVALRQVEMGWLMAHSPTQHAYLAQASFCNVNAIRIFPSFECEYVPFLFKNWRNICWLTMEQEPNCKLNTKLCVNFKGGPLVVLLLISFPSLWHQWNFKRGIYSMLFKPSILSHAWGGNSGRMPSCKMRKLIKMPLKHRKGSNH